MLINLAVQNITTVFNNIGVMLLQTSDTKRVEEMTERIDNKCVCNELCVVYEMMYE